MPLKPPHPVGKFNITQRTPDSSLRTSQFSTSKKMALPKELTNIRKSSSGQNTTTQTKQPSHTSNIGRRVLTKTALQGQMPFRYHIQMAKY